MLDEVVYEDGVYAVIRSEGLFASGFNVYRRTGETDKNGLELYIKVSPRNSFYTTLNAALKFLNTQKET